MFGNLGNIASMMGKLPQLQENMKKMQEELKTVVVEASSGGGVVTAKMNGKFELISIKINKDMPGVADDLEMLEDLVTAAVNMAQQKAAEAAKEKMMGAFGDLGLPNMDQLGPMLGL